MSDVPENAAENCPGTQSESAGRASACQGCPNQSLCSSGAARGPDPDVGKIASRLASIRHKILVLSGKGGVGKSTLSAGLAYALAQNSERQVGLLDLDICGPSQPCIMGCLGEQVHQSSSGWSPIYVEDNLSVMSVGFLLTNPDDAIIWRGPKKNGLIKQFLRDVDWGDVDYLIIDTPPGTSDEHLSVVQYLKSVGGLTGAVIVTTPQEVAIADVRKEINFCLKTNVPILGVVENMAGFVCPKCNHQSALFPPTTGGAAAMCKEMQLQPPIASIPMDPRLARLCDQGKSPFTTVDDDNELAIPKDAPCLVALNSIASTLLNKLDAKSGDVDMDTGECT